MTIQPSALILCLLLGCLFLPVGLPQANASFSTRDALREHRLEREASLKEPYSWLSLSGLFWLSQGENRASNEPEASIRLPKRFGKVGSFVLNEKKVTFIPDPALELPLTLDGEPHSGRALLSTDEDEKPSTLTVGELKIVILARKQGLAVRIWDPKHEARRSFFGLQWFPIRNRYQIEGKFIPYAQEEVRTIQVEAFAGGLQEWEVAGEIEFEHLGKSYRLLPFQSAESKEEFFIVFRDETAGRSTYPAARFLNAKKSADNRVFLDFNRAVNPACAYTPFATCPFPPSQNRLPFAIPAGERYQKKDLAQKAD